MSHFLQGLCSEGVFVMNNVVMCWPCGALKACMSDQEEVELMWMSDIMIYTSTGFYYMYQYDCPCAWFHDSSDSAYHYQVDHRPGT